MVSTRKRTDKPTNSSTSATAQQASKTTVVAPSGTHKGVSPPSVEQASGIVACPVNLSDDFSFGCVH